MKLRPLLIAGALTASLSLPAGALTLRVNGTDRTEAARAELVGDTTYVSLRTVATMLDEEAVVTWSRGTARVETQTLFLSARPGDPYIQAHGRCFYVPGGVKLKGGVTMVPLRALASAMGGGVTWEGAAHTAHLTPGSGVPQAADYDAEDLYWLSRIISAESRGEPFSGKLAVGTVVLNRVAHREFPNTVKEVIFDRRWGGQFQPVTNGTVYDDPTEESVAAAKLCLEGVRVAGESLYFLAPELTNNHWIMKNRDYVTTIGCHWFYA